MACKCGAINIEYASVCHNCGANLPPNHYVVTTSTTRPIKQAVLVNVEELKFLFGGISRNWVGEEYYKRVAILKEKYLGDV